LFDNARVGRALVILHDDVSHVPVRPWITLVLVGVVASRQFKFDDGWSVERPVDLHFSGWCVPVQRLPVLAVEYHYASHGASPFLGPSCLQRWGLLGTQPQGTCGTLG